MYKICNNGNVQYYDANGDDDDDDDDDDDIRSK